MNQDTTIEALHSQLLTQTFAQLITSGGDDRLDLNAAHENRYRVNPLQTSRVFNRGSCTNSPLTAEAYLAAHSLYEQLQDGTIDFDDALEQQRRTILNIYDPANTHGTDIIFAPSGSDLCYLPLMIAMLTSPNRRILNLVTCEEELGSGSQLAHQGRYYTCRSQVCDNLAVGELINPRLKIEYIPYSARAADGTIVDPREQLKKIISQHLPDTKLIVSLVIGSKSGIEDSLSIIEEYHDKPIIWSVDLCQMRAKPGLVQKLLRLNCLLFITGSKFYQAPAFCGGMLIPGRWIEQLGNVVVNRLTGFDKLFTQSDFPKQLGNIQAALPRQHNPGLLLRWEAALAEMVLFNQLPQQQAHAIIQQWHQQMIEEMFKHKEFEPMLGQDVTNKSIISFRLKSSSGYLSYDQMIKIRDAISTKKSRILNAYDKLLIGQPVNYPSGSFLRLALGAHDVRRFHENGLNIENDIALLNAILKIMETEEIDTDD